MHDAAQGSSCLPNQELESLRAGRRAGTTDAPTLRSVRGIPLRGLRWSGTDMNHIRNRIPLAIELANLLLVDVKHQCDLVIALGGLSVYGMQIERAARGPVQDPHQCSLCVPVADVESVHAVHPQVECRFLKSQPRLKICNLISGF